MSEKELARKVVHEIQFFIDDSLDYIDGIEAAIKNGENPLK